jgi:hypothetical protein
LLAALETPTNEEEWSPVVEKSPGGEWTINDSEPACKANISGEDDQFNVF